MSDEAEVSIPEALQWEFRMVDLYCEKRGLPRVKLGLDMQNLQKTQEQLTRIQTRIRKDPSLQEEHRDTMLKFVRWQRRIHQVAIDEGLAKAIEALGAAGARNFREITAP